MICCRWWCCWSFECHWVPVGATTISKIVLLKFGVCPANLLKCGNEKLTCKMLGVGLLVMTVWLELCTSAPVVTITTASLAPVKSRMETFWYRHAQVIMENGSSCRRRAVGNWLGWWTDLWTNFRIYKSWRSGNAFPNIIWLQGLLEQQGRTKTRQRWWSFSLPPTSRGTLTRL